MHHCNTIVNLKNGIIEYSNYLQRLLLEFNIIAIITPEVGLIITQQSMKNRIFFVQNLFWIIILQLLVIRYRAEFHNPPKERMEWITCFLSCTVSWHFTLSELKWEKKCIDISGSENGIFFWSQSHCFHITSTYIYWLYASAHNFEVMLIDNVGTLHIKIWIKQGWDQVKLLPNLPQTNDINLW